MFGLFRPLVAGVCRILCVASLAVLLLSGATFCIATLIAAVQDGSWDHPIYLLAGLSCGLIAGLFIAVFHLRHETHKMAVSQRGLFLAEAMAILHRMGYASSSPEPNEWIFRPRFQAILFGGSIRLAIHGNSARLTGPRTSLELFRRRFRLEHHVNRVQQALQDHRKSTDNLLKRVELQMRLKPEQFEMVLDNVVALLSKGGDVVCDLHLLCQSEQGIRENVVESQIRDWLEQQGIPCDIHKDFVQFVEGAHSGPELQTLSPQNTV
jgi:hypothetical protein